MKKVICLAGLVIILAGCSFGPYRGVGVVKDLGITTIAGRQVQEYQGTGLFAVQQVSNLCGKFQAPVYGCAFETAPGQWSIAYIDATTREHELDHVRGIDHPDNLVELRSRPWHVPTHQFGAARIQK